MEQKGATYKLNLRATNFIVDGEERPSACASTTRRTTRPSISAQRRSSWPRAVSPAIRRWCPRTCPARLVWGR
ncbi:MAG: hypothetical protein ACLSVD_07310 [Eggerthellaceae bacterium]